jgi:hypothetical protein
MDSYKSKQRPPWVQKVIDVKESEDKWGPSEVQVRPIKPRKDTQNS